MIFQEITGQAKAKKILKRVFLSGNIPHAWILSGREGSQNREMANSFAKLLLCASPSEDGCCNTCESCHLFNKKNHPDFFNLQTSGKIRTVKMEPVQELIRFLAMKAYRGGYKVCLIEEASRLSLPAANALLKSLEEPPEKTVFLLCCEREAELLPTIVSRCQVLDFPPLKNEEIMECIQKLAEPPMEPELLLKLAKGTTSFLNPEHFSSLIDKRSIAIEILTDWLNYGPIGAIEGSQKILDFVDNEGKALDKEIKDTLKELKEAPKKVRDKKEDSLIADKAGRLKETADSILDHISSLLRDIMLIQNNMPLNLLYNPDITDNLIEAAKKHPHPEESLKTLDITRKRLMGTVNQKLTLENLLLKILP